MMTVDVAEELEHAWQDATTTSSFIGGQAVERFEEQWAAYCGTNHAVGVGNGTDALELTLRALGIGAGDEVIVPANTFVATVEAVVIAGAIPRFADVHPDTLLVTTDTIGAALSHRTAAVIVVHLFGNMPDMDEVRRFTQANGLALIEDAAQAHGAAWRGRKAGSFGQAGCFSFYPSKNLGAFGDAGAVVTSDGEMASRIRSLGNHGRPPGLAHLHTSVGRNSRLDALQAAVLSAKLPLLDRWNRARGVAAAAYARLLPSNRVRPVKGLEEADAAHHLRVVRVPHRESVRAALDRSSIETGVHYPVPCHLQEPYRRFADGPLPVAESAAREVLSLPLFPHISPEQVERVSGCLSDAVKEADRSVA